MKKKPGVMIYFELRGVLKLLTDAEKGKLFEAILEYGDSGSMPSLDGSLAVIWPLIQRRLDTDNIQYDKTVVKRKYAAYTRWAKQHGEEPESYDNWLCTNGYDLEVHSPALS
jgi:hypothetical protein